MKQYILDRCTDPNDPTLDEVPNEKIPIYEDDDAAEADLANLEVGQIVATKQVYDYTVFDINYPIGVTYTQYPQQKSPNELWGNISTWVELDYDGAFFRSSGGNANGFATSTDTLSSCRQDSQNAYHNHGGDTGAISGCSYACFQPMAWKSYMGTSGRAFSVNGDAYRYSTDAAYDGNGGRVCINLAHTHSIPYDGSSTNTEARPVNYTVKVWVRTA